MIDQILSGQLSKQLIQDLDCIIGLNKGFVLALNDEIQLLKLNSSKHIKVYCFCSKLMICYINLCQQDIIRSNIA